MHIFTYTHIHNWQQCLGLPIWDLDNCSFDGEPIVWGPTVSRATELGSRQPLIGQGPTVWGIQSEGQRGTNVVLTGGQRGGNGGQRGAKGGPTAANGGGPSGATGLLFGGATVANGGQRGPTGANGGQVGLKGANSVSGYRFFISTTTHWYGAYCMGPARANGG